MKKKYRFTVHFYRISQKSDDFEKIPIILKEYQTYYNAFWKYCFYYKFNPDLIHIDVLSKLTPEIQEELKNKELIPYIEAIKLSRAKDAFFSNYHIIHRCKT